MRGKVRFFVSLTFAVSTLLAPAAQAVYKGESALGDEKVLTLASTKAVRSSFCSMAMLSERIVVTAGHCMAAEASSGGQLRFDTNQIWVIQPGAAMSSDDLESRVKVAKVVLVPGYENFWEPAKMDRRTQRDDIAFIFLDKPLKSGYTIPIATPAEISNLKATGGLITHYGYGLQEENKNDYSPYKVKLKALPFSDSYLDSSKTIFTQEDGRALCPGDSGGPWYANFDGITKIVAVTVAAGGCRGNLDPRGWTLGTLISPYIGLMNSEWEKFLAEETTLKAAREKAAIDKAKAEEDLKQIIEAAKKNGTYIQDNSGCHARGVQAILQIQSTNGWVDYKPIDGWVDSAGCPQSHPVQPWNIIETESSIELRWRIWSPGAWEAFTKSITLNPIVKALPTPVATPSPTPTPNVSVAPQVKITPTPKPSSKTITCIKGKIKKKVVGISPKCPTGFKKQ